MIMFAYLLKSYNHTVQGPHRVLCLISYTSYSRYIVHIQEWYESYGRAGLYLGPWKPTGFKAISKRGPCHLGFSCDVFLHVFCCRDKDTFGISQVNQYCIWTSSSLREDMSSKESLDSSWKWAGRTLKSKSPNNKPKTTKNNASSPQFIQHNLDFQVVSMAAKMKTFRIFICLWLFVVGFMFICWFYLVVVGFTCLYVCCFCEHLYLVEKNKLLHGGSST